jgi:uncharacterized protein YjbJ (UPF0337 family)
MFKDVDGWAATATRTLVRRENFDKEELSSRSVVVKHGQKSDRGDVQMNKDNLEGTVRSAVGQGEKIFGQATNDRATTAQGSYDDAAGKVRSAVGSAKDAVSGGVDAISSLDFSGLRDEISKLTQKVSDLAQNQVSAGRDQVVGAMGAAGESLSQSAANAQDKFAALEGDVESRIKKNPWGAVAVAGLIGLLIGKMSWPMRPALELRDLLDQVRELLRVELSLFRAEIGERTSGIPSSVMAVVVGGVLLCVALGLVLVAASLFLLRFGLPLDLAFLIVAAVAIVISLILLRSGVAALKPSRIVPAKSISQISSLFGGL